MITRLSLILGIALAGHSASAQEYCNQIAGAAVIASDGKYLGRLTNEYDSDSIFNEYGNFGSKYSATSIFNEYGNYGSEYSNVSAFNEYTSSPPVLVKNGKAIAYVTANENLEPGLHPYALLPCK